MKRFFEKHSTELSFFLFLALTSGVIALWVNLKPQNHYIQLCLALLLLAVLIPTYLLLRKIWRNTLREPILLGIKKAFIRVSRVLMRAVSRFNIFGRYGNVISGNTSVSYDLFSISKSRKRKKEKPPKPPRWRDMTTARERLGYLYYRTVTKYIKQGEIITAHETPREIAKRFNGDEAEGKMFTLYNSIRYDGRITPDEQEILKLKEELFDK